MQKYKKYQSLLLSVAKKMKKAFAGAGEAVGPVRRTSRGRMSEREGGVCGERIRNGSGCALRNMFCRILGIVEIKFAVFGFINGNFRL